MNNKSDKDISIAQKPTEQSSTSSEDEEIITQLTLAGLKVLMVRKRDQIIYKLPDNMQVASIGEEQRQQLMKEIQSLHAATMAAAATAQRQQQQSTSSESSVKAIAPKHDALGSLDTPPQPTAAEADAIKETARKLREELEQQQQMQLLHQQNQLLRSNQQGQGSDYSTTFTLDGKPTRKYIKTGKYSKKRQQQIQQQLHQHLQQSYPQQQLTQQQLLALQQSLQQQQNVNTNFTNNSSSATTPITTANTSVASTPISAAPSSNAFLFPTNLQQQQQQQQQQENASNKSSPVAPTPPTIVANTTTVAQRQSQTQQSQAALQKNQPPTDSILSKRLPEEEVQHREVKKRCIDSLLADHRAVTSPDYHTPFTSIKDAMDRLLPYHIYQYPKGDLDANKIPLERQDHTMIEIFKCQSDLFDKHATISKNIEKNGGKLSLKILIERQVLAELRQKLTEEQQRVAQEQAAQHQEMLRVQAEKAKLAEEARQQQLQEQQQQQQKLQEQPPQQQLQQQQQQMQQMMQQILPQQAIDQLQQQQNQQASAATAAANYANGLAQASALLQNPQFVNHYSQLSPELQQRLLRNREQLMALIEKQQVNNNAANNNNNQ